MVSATWPVARSIAGTRVDPGERIAEHAEAFAEGPGGVGHGLGAIGLARPDRHQRLEVFFLAQVLALQLDGGHGVGLALADVDGDRDVLLVGRDRDLGGLDVELEVPAVEVIGTQCLEVGIELRARVAVCLGVPVQPAAIVEFEQAAQGAGGERLVADDPQFADARRRALVDREGDIDAVALERCHGGHHFGTVQAAGEVLALELLLRAVGKRLVERLAFTDAEVLEGLDQRVLLEFLQAHELDASDHRAFLDDQHHDASVDLDAHVLEEPGREQRAQCRRSLLVGVGVTDAKRQRGEHRAGVRTLQAFHPDVLEHKGLDCPGRRDGQGSSDGNAENGLAQ